MINNYFLISILIIALVTIVLRFLPFIIFNSQSKIPDFVALLGRVLPCAIMGMLVIYCLRDTSFSSANKWVPNIISLSIVGILQSWKGNTLLSILGGTVCNMLLVQYVFI